MQFKCDVLNCFLSISEYLTYAPCMKEVAPQNELCFNRYSNAMREIQSKTVEQNASNPDMISYQKRKREAADEGIKNVCW